MFSCSGVSSSSETPSGLAPPHVAETAKRPITTQDQGGDSATVGSHRPEHGHQLALNNTRPGRRREQWCGNAEESKCDSRELIAMLLYPPPPSFPLSPTPNTHTHSLLFLSEVGCIGGGGESSEGESPWDMFCPAADLLATPSCSSESNLLFTKSIQTHRMLQI